MPKAARFGCLYRACAGMGALCLCVLTFSHIYTHRRILFRDGIFYFLLLGLLNAANIGLLVRDNPQYNYAGTSMAVAFTMSAYICRAGVAFALVLTSNGVQFFLNELVGGV
jgi:hypothetical protein